jgi:general stress protein CsbA
VIPVEISSAIAGAGHGLVLLRVYGPTLVPTVRRNEHGQMTPTTAAVVVAVLVVAALAYALIEHDATIFATLVPSVMSWVAGGVITQTVAARKKRQDQRANEKGER